MAKQSHDAGKEPVSCRVCHREIPHAEALNIEGQEYTYYFCGYGCFDHWHQGEEKRREKEGKSDSRGARNP